jgi:hypothetical protein
VQENREVVRGWLPEVLRGRFFDFWDEQLVLAVILSVFAFALYFWLVRRLSKGFLGAAVAIVALYVVLNGIVIGSGLVYLGQHPDLVHAWEHSIRPEIGNIRTEAHGVLTFVVLLGLLSFPPMAIGLAGFELSMATAPMVRGSPTDDPETPRGRIRNTRILMVVAALLMSVLVLGSGTGARLLV